jgi:hypothetical protein
MRKLVLALLLVGGLSFAKDQCFLFRGNKLRHSLPLPLIGWYTWKDRWFIVPYYTPVYYVPVEERIIIIHKHKHKHWKHWKEWE